MSYSARCRTCGWEGEAFDTEDAADQDRSDHEVEAAKAEPTHMHHETEVLERKA